jgi:hypothetical protein
MPDKVEPKFGAERFSCPHCGAFAQQTWFRLGMVNFDRGKKPSLSEYDDKLLLQAKAIKEGDAQTRHVAFLGRLKKNVLTYQALYDRADWEFVNFFGSMCYSCDAFAVWVQDKIVYPVSQSVVEPHEMMPANIKADFTEAGSIVNISPRGAAALARLCIQKLMIELGEKGKNINDDIAALVKKGLEAEVQKALDVVRVIGNDAVHPGTIDLKDDKATAMTLLGLVNMIVERRIAGPKKLEAIFAGLPPEKLKQIEQRDKPKGSE